MTGRLLRQWAAELFLRSIGAGALITAGVIMLWRCKRTEK